MKNSSLITSLLLTLILLVLSACGGGGEGNKNATTPLNTTCINGVCDNSYYNQFYQNGFLGYPASNYYGGYAGYCSCPAGYRPVYSGIIGMGCVQINYFQAYSSAAYYYGSNTTTNQYVNIPQFSNMDSTAFGQNSCYTSVAQSCYLNQPSSCSSGYCRAVGGSTVLGVCTQ